MEGVRGQFCGGSLGTAEEKRRVGTGIWTAFGTTDPLSFAGGERISREELGQYLGRAGIQVISGMARGIDGISQQAALSAGGTSYGVLGCGVDICYPAQNRRLYEELLEKGGLLSTYTPGTKPLPQYFPPRNRIVSGLSDALIVIEARQKSGTLITVDMALEHGSGGKNGRKNNRETGRNTAKVKLPKESLQKILECLEPVPKTSETLLQELWEKGEYTDISALNRALMELELLGYARQNSPGHFSTSAN